MVSKYEKIMILCDLADYDKYVISFRIIIYVEYNNGSVNRLIFNVMRCNRNSLSSYISEIGKFINGDDSSLSAMFSANIDLSIVSDRYVKIGIVGDDLGYYSTYEINIYPFMEALKLAHQDMVLVNDGLINDNNKVLCTKYRFTRKINKMKCLLIWMSQKKQNCIFSMLNVELILIISEYVNQHNYNMIGLANHSK
jgi:hypothetical protein